MLNMTGAAIVCQFQVGDQIVLKSSQLMPDGSEKVNVNTGYFGGMRDNGTVILFLRNGKNDPIEKAEFPAPYGSMVLNSLERLKVQS